jgi:hypothetical protein
MSREHCIQVRVVRISKAIYETVSEYVPSGGSHISSDATKSTKVKDAAIAAIAASNTFDSISSDTGSSSDVNLIVPTVTDEQLGASPITTDHLTDASPQCSPVSYGTMVNNNTVTSSSSGNEGSTSASNGHYTQLTTTGTNSSSSQQHHN